MNRRSLDLYSLRAFEAAARALSFSLAAKELNVTHGAISQRVRKLEEQLGVTLFRRHRRGVGLTEEGERLVPVLTTAFDHMERELASVAQDRSLHTLRLSLTPAFATRWLVPRLPRFKALHPGFDVRLSTSLQFVDFDREDFDLAIRCGDGIWPELRVDHLLDIDMLPVCSPRILSDATPLHRPQDLLQFTLIHADVGDGKEIGTEWRAWFRAAGMVDAGATQGISLEDPSLALLAAIDGLGVAIGYRTFAEDYIRSGRLVAPFNQSVRHEFSYYLVYPHAAAHDSKITAFRDWVLGEVKMSA